MSITNASLLQSDTETYARCHEILGIPEEVEWSELKVEFGSGDFGSVTLMLIPTGEQVRDLAELAIMQIRNGCDDAGYAHSDPLEPEG